MAKTIFEELGGRYERQGDYLIPCINVPAEKEQPTGEKAASGLSETAPQGYIYQSSYRRQNEYLPCRY